MANVLKQVVTQQAEGVIPKRAVIQYYDDAAPEEKKQVIVNYDDLTTEEKADFDAFITLSESKMV